MSSILKQRLIDIANGFTKYGLWKGGTGITVDSALSTTSTNPVQNKVVTVTLNGKSDTTHTHDDRYYTESEVNNLLTGKANSSHTHIKSQITDFPSSLPASGGTANAIYDYNDGTRSIKVGFAGAGLTTSNLNYIAGYTDSGTKIKDVSKDVLKSWLGAMVPDITVITVEVASGNNNTNITAPNIRGYNFLCWIGVSSIGFVGTPYLEDYVSQSTKVWDKNPGSGSYHGYPLYVKY